MRKLADEHACEQRPGNRAQADAGNPQLSDHIADRNGEIDCQLGVLGEEGLNPGHSPAPPSRLLRQHHHHFTAPGELDHVAYAEFPVFGDACRRIQTESPAATKSTMCG